MVETNQAYHPQIIRAIIAMAHFEARKEIKQNIQRQRRFKLSKVPARDLTRMAKEMVEANPSEWLARAEASSVVQDEVRRLHEREVRKLLRKLARKSKTSEQLAKACGSEASVDRMLCSE
jgi:hypothetical protein